MVLNNLIQIGAHIYLFFCYFELYDFICHDLLKLCPLQSSRKDPMFAKQNYNKLQNNDRACSSDIALMWDCNRVFIRVLDILSEL